MEPTVRDNAPLRILIVEDEFLIAECVEQALSEQGFNVEIAANARDALRCLVSVPIDVLFTDINLPGSMDGAALARQARELFPDLGVVYASARLGALAPEARVPGGVFVSKPYRPYAIGRLLMAVAGSAAPVAA